MNQSTKTALAAAAVIVLAGAFWLLLLAPKREQASELAEQVTTLQSEVASENGRAVAALAAKREFPHLYRQLVLLGKAVPGDAATPSLLVQLNGLSKRAETSFEGIQQGGGSGGSASAAASGSASATESAAALLPLGATVGPAGLSAMPYTLDFEGGFFEVADFIESLDALVETKDGLVDADGRLITIDGFNLTPIDESDSGDLTANFSVTTYVTPPGQGITAGATIAGPGPETTPTSP